MKIEDKRSSEYCFFHELMQGEVFFTPYEGAIFMKTSKAEVKIGDADAAYPYHTFNAVFLESGELAHFEDEEKVKIINAKVIIK